MYAISTLPGEIVAELATPLFLGIPELGSPVASPSIGCSQHEVVGWENRAKEFNVLYGVFLGGFRLQQPRHRAKNKIDCFAK